MNKISPLDFVSSPQALTLGVELEFQVLDAQTLLLTPRASEIIDSSNNDKLKHEFFQSSLEVITGVCTNIQEADADLTQSIGIIKNRGQELQLRFASTGTHPQGDYRERLITPSPRYHQLTDRNQWLIRRMAVYGMHMHLGMPSGDACIAYNNFFLHFVPHLIALTASSPFWQSMNTGLAASRPTTYEALPTAGMPYIVKNWKEFQKLLQFLQRSHAIESIRDLWWDIRPSPQLGTLELRMCDVPATRREALGVAAFIHALAYWFADHQQEWEKVHAPVKRWIFRENKWRAIRYGLHADIVVSRQGNTRSLKDDINQWLERLQPYINKLSYAHYTDIIYTLLEKGGSSQRQVNLFNASQDLTAVIKNNVQEWETDRPQW